MCPLMELLNSEINNEGSLQSNCDLLFFTPVLCFKAKKCCSGGLSVSVYDRLKTNFGSAHNSARRRLRILNPPLPTLRLAAPQGQGAPI